MKIRNGFVSNSSSASFVLSIQETYDEFINSFISDTMYGDYYNYNGVPKNYKETIVQIKSILNSSYFGREFKTRYQEALLSFLKKNKLGSLDYYDWSAAKAYYDLLFLNENIRAKKAETQAEKTRFDFYTSMNNSSTDVPFIMKELIHFCVAHNKAFSYRVYNDSNEEDLFDKVDDE